MRTIPRTSGGSREVVVIVMVLICHDESLAIGLHGEMKGQTTVPVFSLEVTGQLSVLPVVRTAHSALVSDLVRRIAPTNASRNSREAAEDCGPFPVSHALLWISRAYPQTALKGTGHRSDLAYVL